ncbi:unnamed protein product, partial [Iphiclides podalirius]
MSARVLDLHHRQRALYSQNTTAINSDTNYFRSPRFRMQTSGNTAARRCDIRQAHVKIDFPRYTSWSERQLSTNIKQQSLKLCTSLIAT